MVIPGINFIANELTPVPECNEHHYRALVAIIIEILIFAAIILLDKASDKETII